MPETPDQLREFIRQEMLRTHGRLPFPLDIDSLHSLKKGGFILFGRTTLASGAATVEDRRIQPSSKALVSYDATDSALSNSGTLSVALSAGQLDIASTDGSDASDVSYLIIL